jgi:hypothetical protein
LPDSIDLVQAAMDISPSALRQVSKSSAAAQWLALSTAKNKSKAAAAYRRVPTTARDDNVESFPTVAPPLTQAHSERDHARIYLGPIYPGRYGRGEACAVSGAKVEIMPVPTAIAVREQHTNNIRTARFMARLRV